MADHRDDDGDEQNGGVDGKMVVGGILAVALLLAVVQNTDSTPVNFLFWEVSAPLWLVLIVTGGVAIVIWEIFSATRRRRKAKRDRH